MQPVLPRLFFVTYFLFSSLFAVVLSQRSIRSATSRGSSSSRKLRKLKPSTELRNYIKNSSNLKIFAGKGITVDLFNVIKSQTASRPEGLRVQIIVDKGSFSQSLIDLSFEERPNLQICQFLDIEDADKISFLIDAVARKVLVFEAGFSSEFEFVDVNNDAYVFYCDLFEKYKLLSEGAIRDFPRKRACPESFFGSMLRTPTAKESPTSFELSSDSLSQVVAVGESPAPKVETPFLERGVVDKSEAGSPAKKMKHDSEAASIDGSDVLFSFEEINPGVEVDPNGLGAGVQEDCRSCVGSEASNQTNKQRSILDFVVPGVDNTAQSASWPVASSGIAKPSNKPKLPQSKPKKWMREAANQKDQPKINSFFKKDTAQA